MSYEIYRKVNDKWLDICTGIDSLTQAYLVAELLSTHHKVSGIYKVVLKRGLGFSKTTKCIFDNGGQYIYDLEKYG